MLKRTKHETMKTAIIALLSLALIGALAGDFLQYQRYSSSRPILRIERDSISRKEYQDRLDFLYGKTVLNKLAYGKMIHAAAVKAGVAPTEKDIDARIGEMQRHNPQALGEAKRDPTRMLMLREDIASDIGFENLRLVGVTATDAEVQAFYDKNKAAFGLPEQVETTLVVAQNAVDAATAKGLLEQGMSPETISRQPRLRVVGRGGFTLPPDLPPALSATLNQTVFHMKAGQVAIVPAGDSYLILRMNRENLPGTPPLDQIKPRVARLCKLAKAPPPEQTLAQVYRDSTVTFEVDKYAPFFSDIQAAAKHLDDPKTKTAVHP